MLEQLITEEDNFQPYLIDNHYTFIGPANQEHFRDFFNAANNFAPIVGISRSIHHVLRHRDSVRRALSYIPAGAPLRIFIVTPVPGGDVLLHSDIAGYCERNNITYPPGV